MLTCVHCHGAELRGGKHPAPDGSFTPDLAASGQWPLDAFIHALRTGLTPSGHQMDSDFMPYYVTNLMTDEELAALHAHLATLAADG